MSKQDRQGARTPAALDRKLGAEEVFNRLTNNGQAKGLFRDAEGNLYFNLDYGIAGKLSAEFIDVVNLIAQRLHAENAAGDFVDIQDGQIIAGNVNENETEHFALRRAEDDEGVFALEFNNLDNDNGRVRGGLRYNKLYLGAVEQADAPFSVYASASTNAAKSTVKVRLPDAADHYATPEKELYVYWKDNGDGSYSPVGYENELQ